MYPHRGVAHPEGAGMIHDPPATGPTVSFGRRARRAVSGGGEAIMGP